MTRARERLILSGAARFANWPAETASAIAWLGPALVADLAARVARGRRRRPVVRGAGDVALRLTLCAPEDAERAAGRAAPARAASTSEPRAATGAATIRCPTPLPSMRVVSAQARRSLLHGDRRVRALRLPLPPAARDRAARRRAARAASGERTRRRAASSSTRCSRRLDFAAARVEPARQVADAAARRRSRARAARGSRRARRRWPAAFARSPLCARLAAAPRGAPRGAVRVRARDGGAAARVPRRRRASSATARC